jgi:glutamate N-acetyltransferase/amino-acid N-acetyltransferase
MSASATPAVSAAGTPAGGTATGPAGPAPMLPLGFTAAAAAAAIKKPGRDDMGLIRCPAGATLAAVYTTNRICAAPVQLSRRHLAESRGHCGALLVNSGCANAATGERGMANAIELAEAVARACDIATVAVQENSTGVIGVQLPIDRMLAQVAPMAARAAHGTIEVFARAIMTTDTYPKWASRTVEHAGRRCTVVGCVKGAGMIHPNMATMIGTILTDAALTPAELDGHLRAAVERSFHRISIDGDTSTNDSIFAMASGAADPAGVGFPTDALRKAFTEVARDLALLVVRDGEGYERGIHVRVTGAASDADALTVAKTIASSLLVRCAVTGGDPNWGRILAAAGRAGVRIDIEDLSLTVGGVKLFAAGAPADTPLADREAAFRQPMVQVVLDLGQGTGTDEFISCGLTKAYVELNADYTT